MNASQDAYTDQSRSDGMDNIVFDSDVINEKTSEPIDDVANKLHVSGSEDDEAGKKPWFGRRLVSFCMPNGGFLSGVFNLAGSSLGAGIFALPKAMDISGIIMGTIYLVVILFLTVFSVRILAIASNKTGIRSYEGLAHGLFGRFGGIFAAVIMFLKCFGACMAYVICFNNVWLAFLRDDRITGYYSTISFRRVLTSITFIVLMLPLSLPKRINSLRYVSLVGVSFILYFVACVIAHAGLHGAREDIRNKNLVLFRSGNDAIMGLGKFMFAYLCQSNMFEVYNEILPHPTVRRMEMECMVGMLICTVLYWLTSFFCYLDFGTDVLPSLLVMYEPLKDVYFFVAYCGIVIKLCVAFALHILPCRDAIHHLIHWELNTIAWWKNAILCAFMSLLSLLGGIFIEDLSIVFNLLGSFTGGFIAFVFPSLFLMYAGSFTRKSLGWYDFYGSFVLLLCGVAVICFGTTATIFGLV